MKPTTTSVATTASRPNRLLIALAAAWMAISLAIGGTVTADLRAEASGTDTASMSRTAQP
jgi:hypothetical protein